MASDPNPAKTADPDAAAVERGYEARDIHVGGLVLLLGGFVVLFAAACAGLWALTKHELTAARGGEAKSVLTKTSVGRDAPPLQPQANHESLDAWDLAKMHGQEDWTFEQMGWRRDDRAHRFAVPAAVLESLRTKRPASGPTATPTTHTAAAATGGR